MTAISLPAWFPYTCPVCSGMGKISRPPNVAGDVSEWASGDTTLYPCPACSATGIIWKEIKPQE